VTSIPAMSEIFATIYNLVVGPPKTSLCATLTLLLGFGPLSPYFLGHTHDIWANFVGGIIFGPPILVFGPLLGHFTTFWATFIPFIGPL
jgi:hypothetical protein